MLVLPLSAVPLLSIFLLLFYRTDALFLEVEHHSTRCLGQNLDSEDAAVFVISSHSAANLGYDTNKKKSIEVAILDPKGTTVHSETADFPVKTPIVFTYNVELNGVHKACVTALADSEDKDPFHVSINIDFKSRSGKQKSGGQPRQFTKEDLSSLEDKLKSVEETLSDISKEIDFARRQELLLKEAGENTHSRIRWFQIFSISVLLITAIWQLVYWRRFFKSKKLL